MSVIVAPFPVEVYEQVHWPTLRDTLDALLTTDPGAFKPISYEQVYSTVYKCVCRAYGERLYRDLTEHLASHVCRWAQSSCGLCGPDLAVAFHGHLQQYVFALQCVVSVFTYLDRFYVVPKLQTDLKTALSQLFMEHLADRLAPRVVGKLGLVMLCRDTVCSKKISMFWRSKYKSRK